MSHIYLIFSYFYDRILNGRSLPEIESGYRTWRDYGPSSPVVELRLSAGCLSLGFFCSDKVQRFCCGIPARSRVFARF